MVRGADLFLGTRGAKVKQEEPEKPHPVTLHIYHVGPVTSFLNGVLRAQGLGLYHCGVEVMGVEWSFHGIKGLPEGDETTGVCGLVPKTHPRHIYTESVEVGVTILSERCIARVVYLLTTEWLARYYNVVERNCVDFAEQLTKRLEASGEFPKWVHGAAKNPSLSTDTVRRFSSAFGCLWSTPASCPAGEQLQSCAPCCATTKGGALNCACGTVACRGAHLNDAALTEKLQDSKASDIALKT